MATRKFGIKPSGYRFQVEFGDNNKTVVTKVASRMLKDGSWTFYNHEYKDKGNLDVCMTYAFLFLLDKGATKFSTVGVKKDLPMLEYAISFADRRTDKRVYMRENAHRLIYERVSTAIVNNDRSVPIAEDAIDVSKWNFSASTSSSPSYKIDLPIAEQNRADRDRLFAAFRWPDEGDGENENEGDEDDGE